MIINMVQPPYHTLDFFLEQITSPNKEPTNLIYEDNIDLFKKAYGSKVKHQAWEGGYIEHVEETMNHGMIFYAALAETQRRIPFSLSDVYLILALHDIEKPFKQSGNFPELEINGIKQEQAIKEFKLDLLNQYSFQLTPEHKNALEYCEGEKDEYHPTKRVMNELAAFCHMCDVWSARGAYQYPLLEKDPWKKN